MKKTIVILFVSLFICNESSAQFWKDIEKAVKKQDVDQILKKGEEMITGSSSGMTQSRAAEGLKIALNQGTGFASNNLSQIDGYLANAAVKILFPPEARKVESKLRQFGFGNACDQFITSVNRAAEHAVVEAKPIFAQAIRSMTINDAIGILTGDNNSATTYLRSTSVRAMHLKFEPIIKTHLDKVNATKYWSNVMTAYNNIPFVEGNINPNLSQYVTEKAIDGIFFMVAKEELKIRQNPSARVGSILQDVFGWADRQK